MTDIGCASRPSLPCVLVADDDLDCRNIYGLALEAAGFRVVTAIDGHDAVEQAIRERPGLILMDVAMPHLDGIAALKAIRAHPALGHVPVAAVTASATVEDRRRLLKSGFAYVVFKPVMPKDLVGLATEILMPAGTYNAQSF